MSVTASTALDPIVALALNVVNGVVDVFTQLGTDKDAIVAAIIVFVTIAVVYKFGDKIVGFFDKLFGRLGSGR